MTDTQILKGIEIVFLILFIVFLILEIVTLIRKIREEVPFIATNIVGIIGFSISAIIESIAIFIL